MVATVFMGNRCHSTKYLLLFRASYPRWSLLGFRWHVVRCQLEINGRARYNQDVVFPKRNILKELRLSEQRHLVDDDPLKKARHCKVCILKTQVICTTCKVYLHVKCCSTYHSIFHLDLLLSNVKNTCFAFIFLFCDED